MNLKRCALCGALFVAAHFAAETLEFCDAHKPEREPVVAVRTFAKDPNVERAAETYPDLAIFVRDSVAVATTSTGAPPDEDSLWQQGIARRWWNREREEWQMHAKITHLINMSGMDSIPSSS